MDTLFLELGIFLFVALIGGIIALKIKQTTMIGYLIFGLLLSPSITFTIFGYHYHGIIVNSEIPSIFSQLGLVMILFFIGLNIAPQKFKKTSLVATVLGIIDISIMFTLGILIGYIFHWDIYDSIFLGFVISASSVVVTAKSVDDLRKLSVNEAEALLNMLIIEDIISIFMIVLFSGFLVTKIEIPQMLNIEYLGIGSFLSFIIIITWIFLPSIKRKISTRKNDELFVIFILMIVFFLSALLEIFNITPAVGAFFAGMLFSETSIAKEIELKLGSFKYAFGALFFVTYGLNVNLYSFIKYYEIILLSVILIIIGELFIMSTVAYFVGFSSKGSIFIGAGLIPRNEDSLIFANIAKGISSETNQSVLPYSGILISITGAIVIITTLITPIFLRISTRFSRFLTNSLPESLKYSAGIISKTLRSIFFHRNIPIAKSQYLTGAILAIYVILILTDVFYFNHFVFLLTFIILILNYFLLRKMLLYKFKNNAIILTSGKGAVNHVNFTLYGSFVFIFVIVTEWYFYNELILFTPLIFILILIMEYIIYYHIQSNKK